MDRPEELEFAWLILIGITLTFFLSLAVVVFVIYYQRKIYNQNLDMEQLKQEEQQKRLEAAIQAQEHERSRIARDLHDEVGVILSTAKLYLTNVSESVSDQGMPQAERVEVLLDEAVGKLRSISRNLSSEHLAKFGLEKALADSRQQIEEAGGPEINLDFDIPERLPQELELQLYRILRELLNNTLKHAQATRIDIQLNQKGQTISLDYTDNGVGLDLEQVGAGGLGLQTLSGRVQILHGEIDLQSAVGQGFNIQITIPKTKN